MSTKNSRKNAIRIELDTACVHVFAFIFFNIVNAIQYGWSFKL